MTVIEPGRVLRPKPWALTGSGSVRVELTTGENGTFPLDLGDAFPIDAVPVGVEEATIKMYALPVP